MKKSIYLFLVILLSACSVSDDCIKNAGTQSTRVVDTGNFTKIMVNSGISLVVSQGDQYNVTIHAGNNFIGDIEAKVTDGVLKLSDHSGCNWVRDYGATTVHVTAPNIEEIYSNTEQDIVSNGVLTFPVLRLFAMDFFGGVGTNNFIMQVSNQQLVIESNNVAAFFITGNTEQMLLNFYDGTGRFEGADFLANDIKIFQRGSNDMIIHPMQSLTGNIYSTGNVICKSQPAVIDVTQHYHGRLIFE